MFWTSLRVVDQRIVAKLIATINFFPPNDTVINMLSWSSHKYLHVGVNPLIHVVSKSYLVSPYKLMGIYMGNLILSVIL